MKTQIERWYDKEPRVREMMRVMRSMNDEELDTTAKILYCIVSGIKESQKNQDNLKSVGREKLMGYYNAYRKRRWYDKNQALHKATTILSMMPSEEMNRVVDLFISALKSEDHYEMYSQRKIELNK